MFAVWVMNRKVRGKFSSISYALASVLSASWMGGVGPAVAVENINGGLPPDVTLDALGLVRPYFNGVQVGGVQLGRGGLPSSANGIVADDEGVTILSERPREYVTNDYTAASFRHGGGLGSCL